MSDDELNKYIHEKVMGECWQGDIENGTDDEGICLKCGFAIESHSRPDYCSEQSPRELLSKAIEKVDNDEAINRELQALVGWASYEIRATAKQIALAIYRATKEAKEL